MPRRGRPAITTSVITELHFGVLGPVTVEREDTPLDLGGPKQRAVLAILLASPGEVVSAERIVTGIWGEDASGSNRASLQTYISNLRAVLGDAIPRSGDGYRLDIAEAQVDAMVFEEALEQARQLLATDADQARTRLREALALWRGLPYADLSEFVGLQTEIDRLEELRLAAVELRIDADLASGLDEAVIPEVAALATEHPLRERFRAQHMLALYRSGRQAEALRAYQHTKDYLADELGLEPSQELQDLELAILQQDEELRRGPGRPTTQRLAFLVTDIEDSTRAWDAHPQAMAEALASHDRILIDAIENSGGRLFKHTGDGVLAAFPDLVSAVETAEEAQRALVAAEWGEVGELRIRMGIDIGEAEARGGDFYGPPLNRAARLSAAAHGGQVLVSGSAQGEIADSALAGLQIRQLGEHRLRGFTTPERVGQLVFVGLPADFPELRIDADSPLESPAAVSLPGYEIRDQIGEGAFGVVYRAYQPSVGREVAVKIIRPELASHPAFVHRFEAEARTVARLAHPRIVPLIDFWRDPEGAYLVLLLLPGGSLQQVLAGGDIDRGPARTILRHIAEALDHAHSQGIVHGDLNPANVLLDGSHNAYLTDFSIPARILDPETVASVSAAPEFRAPEERATGPSAAADIYALGVIARRLLADPEAEPVLARAAAANPEDRFSSASAFVAELDKALGEEPTEIERPTVSRNPYKGLRAFEASDAGDFYGREELVASLIAAVGRHRFVTVVGPSGSGKSSVVQAGLLPKLAEGAIPGSEQWLWVVATPGPRPIESLLEALETVAPEPMNMIDLFEEVGLPGIADRLLANTDGELVLIIDQMEELFTLVDDSSRRQTFFDQLIGAASNGDSRLRVLTTLRADFYDRPLEHPGLDRLVRDGLVTVLRPNQEELVEIITAPSHSVGLRWEPGLPYRIADDVVDQPGGLPLLQYALTELVERRHGDLLTGEDYERIGGVAGALATRAEAVFAELSPRQQAAARQVFLRLVSVDEETDDTRRRVRRSELESLGIERADLNVVLDSFTSERLLLADRDPVTRGPTVEVAHEALLREWPRLRDWIEDQREALILGRRFRGARDDWENADRQEDYLLTGSRLAPFLAWADSSSLSSEEREFFEASRRKDLEEQEARHRRRRTLVGVLAGAAGVALVLAGWAFLERGRATEEADRASAEASQRLAAQREAEGQRAEAEAQAELAQRQTALAEQNAALARSRELAASAINVLDNDPALSKLLALAASDIADPPIESVSALHQAFQTDRVVARYSWPDDVVRPWSLTADLHPSGARLVASGESGIPSPHLEVVDIATGDVLWAWAVTHPGVAIERPRFSEDGNLVITGALWESRRAEESPPPAEELGVFIFDAESGDLIRHLDMGRCGATVQAISGSRILVKTVSVDEAGCFFPTPPTAGAYRLELLDLETGASELLTANARIAGFTTDGGAAFSGDGRIVAFDDLALERVVVIEVASGERIAELDLVDPERTDSFVWRLNQDGSRLVYGRGPIHVVEVASGQVVAEIEPGNDAWVELVGSTVLVTAQDGALYGYEADTGSELFALPGVGNGTVSANADGLALVSNGTDGAVLIDTRSRGEIGAVETCPAFTWSWSLTATSEMATFLQACEGFATSSTTQAIDLTTMEVAYTLTGGFGQQQPISPDGTRFVRQNQDGIVAGPLVVHDLRTGEPLLELPGTCRWDTSVGFTEECMAGNAPPFAFFAQRVRWSPDGRMIGATSATGPLAVWDAQSGDLLLWESGDAGPFEGDLNFHSGVVFTPDSSALVTSYWGPAVRRFSTETWELEFEAALPTEVAGQGGLTFVDYTEDGSTVVAATELGGGGVGASLHWLDADTMEPLFSRENPHEGGLTVMTMNRDRSLLATGSGNGVIRIWNSATGELIHELLLGDSWISGLAFIDDSHLAVVPRLGSLFIVTIDTQELLGLASESLTRGFTEFECEKYNFGDACPTLEEMRAGR